MRSGTAARYTAVIFAFAAATGLAFRASGDGAPPSSGVRNVIVMIGDGRGFAHVDAASLWAEGRTGTQLSESLPLQLAMSTWPYGGGYDPALAWQSFDWVRTGPTDSAASATALATGHKTYNGAIGVAGADAASASPVENVLERAERRGKATGVVTSVPLSHATPAGFVAHTSARGSYAAIARQMIGESALEVIMGCGHPEWAASGVRRDPAERSGAAFQYVGGQALWNAARAGTAGADRDGDGDDDPWRLVETREQFVALAEGRAPARVLGVAQAGGTLQQDRPGDAGAAPFAVPLVETVPTLAEMARGALAVLDRDPDGFVVMIEGGAIDWAAHANQTGRAIEEALGFNDAIAAVIEWVESHGGWESTLLVVTSDHETGYLTGPGSGQPKDAPPVWHPLESRGRGQLPGVQWNSGGHTNSLVPFAARGAGAERFAARATQIDPVRGAYLDSTDLAQTVFELLH